MASRPPRDPLHPDPVRLRHHGLAHRAPTGAGQADYEGGLDTDKVEAELRRGRPGSAPLRWALHEHQPELVLSRSHLEDGFFGLCEAGSLPLPELNARVEGWPVDAVWRKEKIVVELDGWDNHHTPGQLRRDRRKELELRAAGYIVLRYSYDQVIHERQAVLAELRRLLAERALAA